MDDIPLEVADDPDELARIYNERQDAALTDEMMRECSEVFVHDDPEEEEEEEEIETQEPPLPDPCAGLRFSHKGDPDALQRLRDDIEA